MTIYSNDRRRCVTPDGRPGAWQSPPQATFQAMQDAIRTAHGKGMDGSPVEAWAPVTAEWRRLSAKGWTLETEA